MNSGEILYSAGKNDECLTPAYAVAPIVKYIPMGATVWCPFDKADSKFVTQISKHNPVTYSHIDDNEDYFLREPDRWDVMVSNPPFTGKREIFERALSFEKPFALMMSNTWLNDSAPKQLFRFKMLQLLMFDKRIHFSCGGVVDKRTTFSTSYFCWNFLPAQIIMETLRR